MKLLFFILLAGYAVRSDENNYYVIEMPDDPPIQTKKPFKVYWNVPTMQCSSKKIYFDNLYEDFGIIQNDNDRFKGENITILYDPGLFPALFKNETSGKFRFRNGGVPQEGNLTKHLDAFTKDLDQSIPDKNFSGVGIIDFESWRPVFRQNFGVLQPYKDVSIEIERKLHWWWKKTWIEAEAKRRFEEAARTYMQSSLSVSRRLRPRARWGFYGFPYCFNMASNNMVEECAAHVPQENDQISWLWSESTALYPSVYSSSQLSTSQLVSLIRGRVREAARCGNNGHTDILPYFWFRYRDAGFLTQTDLSQALSTLYESNATGILIWGSSNDVNTVTKCNNLLNYVKTVLGPAIAKYTKPSNKLNEESVVDNTTRISTNATTNSPIFNDTSNLTTTLHLDPEYHWSPPENYSQEIKNNVAEEINRRFGQNVTDEDDRLSVLHNNSVLIDLILNAVLISVDNVSSSTDAPKTTSEENSHQDNEDITISTTELSYVTSTVTSQVTSSIVTNNPLLNEINDKSQSAELQINGITEAGHYKYDKASTTDKTETETVPYDKVSTYLLLESGSVDSVDEVTTEKSNFFASTENDNDAILDYEDDYFFDMDTFTINNSFTSKSTDDFTTETATDFQSKLTIKQKKEFQTFTTRFSNIPNVETDSNISKDATTTDKNNNLQNLSSELTDIDSITKTINEDSKNYTEKNEDSESSTNSTNITRYIDSFEIINNQTEITTSQISTIEGTVSEITESSPYNSNLVIKSTNAKGSQTPDSDSPEMSTTIKIPDFVNDLDTKTESETSMSISTEETTTSKVPTTTTEQVSGSASRLKWSQYLFCIILYIYVL